MGLERSSDTQKIIATLCTAEELAKTVKRSEKKELNDKMKLLRCAQLILLLINLTDGRDLVCRFPLPKLRVAAPSHKVSYPIDSDKDKYLTLLSFVRHMC